MKKFKFMFIIFVFMFILCGILTSIYALGGDLEEGVIHELQSENNNINRDIGQVGYKIYGTIMIVIQVIAVAGVVYTGYKYMIAGANEKGEIKQTLIYMIIGTIFVFAADSIIKFIINAGDNLFGNANIIKDYVALYIHR